MRVGFITGEYPPMQGGVGDYTHALAHALVALGHDVRVLSTPPATDQLLPLDHGSGWGPWALWHARRWARAHALDLVSLQLQTAAFGMSPWVYALPNALRCTAPIVVTFHDLRPPYLFPKAGPARHWIVDRLARAAAGAVATNPEDAAYLRTLTPTAHIPIGSNIPAAPPPTPRPPDDTLQLAHFGFINHSKGLPTLLEALHTLRARGVNTHLTMIGARTGTADATNSATAAALDDAVRAWGLGDALRWTGYTDPATTAAHLAAADLVVLPYSDGASTRRGTLLAALVNGCAIVTTTPTVPTPHLVHGESVWLVPPGDAAALANAVQHLATHPDLAQRLRDGARAHSSAFAWPTLAEAFSTFAAARAQAWRATHHA